MAETLTIKTHTVRTNITKVTRMITLTTRRDLRTMFYKHLKVTKPEEAGDRFGNPDPVMTEAIINIGSQRMLTPTVMEDFAIWREVLDYGQIGQLEGSVVNREEGQWFVDVLQSKMLGVDLQ